MLAMETEGCEAVVATLPLRGRPPDAEGWSPLLRPPLRPPPRGAVLLLMERWRRFRRPPPVARGDCRVVLMLCAPLSVLASVLAPRIVPPPATVATPAGIATGETGAPEGLRPNEEVPPTARGETAALPLAPFEGPKSGNAYAAPLLLACAAELLARSAVLM